MPNMPSIASQVAKAVAAVDQGAAQGALSAAAKIQGGKRTKRKPSSWNKAVKRVYEEMKRKNRNATFGEALRVASQRKKNGTL
jgi:hypothetical protein